jgi:hypothetical protein
MSTGSRVGVLLYTKDDVSFTLSKQTFSHTHVK